MAKASYNELSVRLHGLPVGTLRQSRQTGRLDFSYSEAWATHPKAMPISVSMPLRTEPYDDKISTAFFAGLLPDNDSTRALIARRFQVSAMSPFGLLSAIGYDCAGALQIVRPDWPVREEMDVEPEVRFLSDIEVAEIIKALPQRPLGLDADGEFRISLAGAQHKTAVYIAPDGRVGLPLKGTPSSHILKPPIEKLAGIVQNEHFCMVLAGMLGLPVPMTSVRQFGDQMVIVIERYDRQRIGDKIRRLHQEDFCQALGIHPDLKYQKDGGPTAVDCVRLLERSQDPAADRFAMVGALAFNWLIGGTDAHAKNYSLLYGRGGVRLAPFYDLASGLAAVERPDKARLAMKIGGERKFRELMPRHWRVFAREAGVGYDVVRGNIVMMIEGLPAAVEKAVMRCRDEGVGESLVRQLADVILRQNDWARNMFVQYGDALGEARAE